MHASVFHVDLGTSNSARDRGRAGRALATALGDVRGFIAFIALETAESAVAGFCICVDAAALDDARQVAETWQRERTGPSGGAIEPLLVGKVIVQRGF